MCINIYSTQPDILKGAELLERTHQSLNTCEKFCGIFIYTANIRKCLVHMNIHEWLLDYSYSTNAHSCVLGITAEENKILRDVGSSLLQTVKTFGGLHNPATYSSWIYLFALLYAPSGWPGFRTFSHSSCRIRRCSANSASEMKPELIVLISKNKCK
jgi:hypothetical protein